MTKLEVDDNILALDSDDSYTVLKSIWLAVPNKWYLCELDLTKAFKNKEIKSDSLYMLI